MGMTLCIDRNMQLNFQSISEISIKIRAIDDGFAKSNENECKMIVKGFINRNVESNAELLQGLTKWAKACGGAKGGYKSVELVQDYGELFSRTSCFSEARLTQFKEIFDTTNKKYLEIYLEITQKESKSEEISFQFE